MTDSNNLPLTYLTCSKVVPSLVSASGTWRAPARAAVRLVLRTNWKRSTPAPKSALDPLLKAICSRLTDC